MSLKRKNTIESKGKSKKYKKTRDDEDNENLDDRNDLKSVVDTKTAIDYLLKFFPKQGLSLPPVIYVHQIYSLIKNRTKVDLDLDELRQSNEIKLFKFDCRSEDTILCKSDIFIDYIEKLYLAQNDGKKDNLIIIRKFVDTFLRKSTELYINKRDLVSYKFSDSNISVLIQHGLLNIKDSSSWWFSIPNIGSFRRITLDARQIIDSIIRKKRYNELNVDELRARNINKLKIFGLFFHCYDLIGKDAVIRIDSPMGFILKLNNS